MKNAMKIAASGTLAEPATATTDRCSVTGPQLATGHLDS